MNLNGRKNVLTILVGLNLVIVVAARGIGDYRIKRSEIIPPEENIPSGDVSSLTNDKKLVNDNLTSAETSNTNETVAEEDEKSEEFDETEKEGDKTSEELEETEEEKDETSEELEETEEEKDETSEELEETEEEGNKTSEDLEVTEEEEDKTSEELEETEEEEDKTSEELEETEEEEEETSEELEETEEDYANNRADVIGTEEKMSFGSDVQLQDNEFLANNTLMKAKFNEIDEGFADQGKFLPRSNFLKVRQDIEKSKVFQIIKKMPKGCLLHAHDVGTVSQEYVLNNITYRPNLYICDSENGLKLKFFETPGNDCDWKLLSELRENPASENEINERIQQHISMITDNPAEAYPDGDKAWVKFQGLFDFLSSFMRYKPVYEDYYYQLLQENYDDKVLYVELRVSLPKLYDLNGNVYEAMDVVKIIKDVVDRFVADHSDFVGVKIIYSKRRLISNAKLQNYLKTFQQIKQAYPTFIAGFDLVGQEDKGIPLKNFTNQLRTLEKEHQTFFHAGETDWYGLSTDQNLIDAVLMNTKRIGHGYALPKHPVVMQLVKKRGIAIEVNPISNQVLNLVSDLRNHPASILFAENYPVVVCSDDPGLWGAKGLSYDFYEAFMGIMSRSSDLRALIKLGINSIEYSAMNEEEKLKARDIFQRQWADCLDDIAEMGDIDDELSGNNVPEE